MLGTRTELDRNATACPLLAAILLAVTAQTVFAWQESDFRARAPVDYVYSLDGRDLTTVIGDPRSYTFARNDTLLDVARHLGLGINEVTAVFPDLDVWLPPLGETRAFPTWWVLPGGDYQGIVVNIPEMRVYYFPNEDDDPRTVVTYPAGLGRDGWHTPTGRFTITEKTVNPTWVIPESIREEHIRERGDFRRAISGGGPNNPLGGYRLRLNLPLYGIHGTNVPWGVGRKASHGCLRLYPEDIEHLFAIVPVGTLGELVYQPVKIGARDGDIYIEVHPDIYDTGFDYMEAAKRLPEDKGWSNLVNWGRLTEALEGKRGVPTRISDGQPLLRPAPEPEEAQGYPPPRPPTS